MANRHSEEQHVSSSQKILRALLGILSAVGFGALWYAIFHGAKARPYAFIIGFLLVVNALYHIVVAIRKPR